MEMLKNAQHLHLIIICFCFILTQFWDLGILITLLSNNIIINVVNIQGLLP